MFVTHLNLSPAEEVVQSAEMKDWAPQDRNWYGTESA